MLYAVVWFGVLFLLSLWSLTTWAIHSISEWMATRAGELGAGEGFGGLQLPESLTSWLPPEVVDVVAALLAGAEPILLSLLQAAPALAGGFTVAVWVVWAIGSMLLVGLGAAVHAMIAIWRRRSGNWGPRQA